MKKLIFASLISIFSLEMASATNNDFAVMQDSLPKRVEKRRIKMIEEENGEKIELTAENGKILSIVANGKEVPKEKYTTYKALIDRAEKELAANESAMNRPEKEMKKVKIASNSEQTVRTKKNTEQTTITVQGSNEELPIEIIVKKDGTITINGEAAKDGAEMRFRSNIEKEIIENGKEIKMTKEERKPKMEKRVEKEIKIEKN